MAKSPKERTKVVVRKLPPGLNEQGFKAVVEKLIEGKHTWMTYCEGKASVRKVLFSRAYINFSDPASVYDFKTKFDGHTFVSSKGNQYKCSVEYAPFQKVPSLPKKRNPLEGTIDQDADYQAFAKALEEGPELLPSAAIQREQQEKAAAKDAPTSTGKKEIRVTPLMEYLHNRYLNNPSMRPGRRGVGGRAPQRHETEKESKGQGGRGKDSGKGKKDARESQGRVRSARGADSSKAERAGPSRAATATAKEGPASGRGRGKQERGVVQKAREHAEPAPAPKVLLARPKQVQDTSKEHAAAAAAPAAQQHHGKEGREPKGRVTKDSKIAGHEQPPPAKGKGGRPQHAAAAAVGDASTSRPSTAQQHGGRHADKNVEEQGGEQGEKKGEGRGKAHAEGAGRAKAVRGSGGQKGHDGASTSGTVEAVSSAMASLTLPAKGSAPAKGIAAGGSAAPAAAPKVLMQREPQRAHAVKAADKAAPAAVSGEGPSTGVGDGDGKGRKVRKGFQAYVPSARKRGGGGDGDAG